MAFGKDFIWGAATASYQIEGSARDRAQSVWDECARRPGFVKTGATGDTACDHMHHLDEDIAIMRDMGLQAYRFSFSWPRILPDGVGKPDTRGLAFYDRLVDALLENNIRPFATLFHWDYPVALYRRGGWLNPDSPKWFAEYAQVLADRYSDRIEHWITINEPQCFIDLGLREGTHAPGVQLPFDQVLLAAHHTLLAHGLAIRVLRARGKKRPSVGYALTGSVYMPCAQSDVAATMRAYGEVREMDLFNADTWWADPVFLGRYPEDGVRLFERYMPEIGADDMSIISEENDFFGLNLYNGVYVTTENGALKFMDDPYDDFTAMGWPVTPGGLYWKPRFLYERYKKPIYILENGMAGTDLVNADGTVPDAHRIEFTKRYLRELKRAVADGVDVRGYFHWSLLDNFEWAEGYTKRFGLVYVDYRTGKRTVKDSGRWYKDVIAANGEGL